jgi:hypothetical protein
MSTLKPDHKIRIDEGNPETISYTYDSTWEDKLGEL